MTTSTLEALHQNVIVASIKCLELLSAHAPIEQLREAKKEYTIAQRAYSEANI